MARWIFQSLAEPIEPISELGSIDKFEPQVHKGQMWAKIGLSAAILAGSFFYQPDETSWAGVDKWQPKVVDYHYQKPQLSQAIQAGSFFAPPTTTAVTYTGGSNSLYSIKRFQYQSLAEPFRTIETQKYTAPTYPDFLLRKSSQIAAIQAGSCFFVRTLVGFIETVTSDKWTGQYPDYIRRPKRIPWSENAVIADVPLAEVVNPDKWNPKYSDLLLPKSTLSRAIQSGSLFLGDIPRAETISLDKWLPDYPDFARRIIGAENLQPIQSFYPFSIIEDTWKVDKWQSKYPDYFKRSYLSQAIQAGSLFFVDLSTVELINVDKWHPEYADILFKKSHLIRAIQAGNFFYDFGIALVTTPAFPDVYSTVYPDILLPKRGMIDAIRAGSYFVGEETITAKIFTIYVWKRTG